MLKVYSLSLQNLKGFGGSYIMRFGLLAMQKNEFIEPLGISNNGKTVIGGLLWL